MEPEARDLADVPAAEVIASVAVHLMSAAAVKCGLAPEGDAAKDLDEARKLISNVRFADSALDAVDGADAVVLVTEWKEFKPLDWGAMAGTTIIDGRNALDPATVRAAGLVYEGIGRGSAA